MVVIYKKKKAQLSLFKPLTCRGSGGIAPCSLNLCTTQQENAQPHALTAFYPVNERPVHNVQKARSGRAAEKYFAHAKLRTPNHPPYTTLTTSTTPFRL